MFNMFPELQELPKEIPGTTYTLILDDDKGFLYTSNGSAVTITVPPNSSVPFQPGASISFAQQGAGKLTLAAGNGVTINPAATLSAGAQYGVMGLYQISPNVWTLFGNIAA